MRKFMQIGAGLALLAAVSSANATIWSWSFSPGTPYNNTAGTIISINSSFDDATDVLTWSATFGGVPNSALVTSGFTLALTDGPNPKGQDGELALLYFDASTASPKLTVYGYNGVNAQTSHSDGSGASGTQSPDRIISSIGAEASSVLGLSAVNNGNGTRTLSFSLDATSLNAHVPLHAGADPWTGARYDDHIGLWFHPVAGLTTAYNANGFLTNWSPSRQGWLDLNDQNTVPEPGALALLALGLPGMFLRRR